VSIENIRVPLTVIWERTSINLDKHADTRSALLKVKTESLPSEEAHARIAPSSCGPQETEFTAKSDFQYLPAVLTLIMTYLRPYARRVP